LSQNETEEKTPRVQFPVRPDKHLARGLEDVSHLFLSRASAGAGHRDGPQGDAQGYNPPHSGEGPVFLLEDPSRPIDKESLITLLHSNIGRIEDGLKAIDMNVPVDSESPVGLVAVDRRNKPVLVDVDISGRDELFLRGIYHFDWFVRNTPVVQRMYREYCIDYMTYPRIVLVAPKFSELLRCAARRFVYTKIDCYQYRSVAGPDGNGILLFR
jgi:hypothetical protein